MAYVKKLFDPSSQEPFRVSRYRLDIFMECPRCAYLDLRLGVGRVQGPAFTLNNAVDELLKKEFDIHRAAQTAHPLMKAYRVEARPFDDPQIEAWRDARRRGISYHDPESNITLSGGIDDVWVTPKEELIIVDYKATSKKEAPKTEDDLYDAYKRQIEIYQWLFRKNRFTVSPTAYFVYVNGRSDARAFDGKLEFDVNLVSYRGDDSWVSGALRDLRATLSKDTIPPVGKGFSGGPCDYCTYREAAGKAFAVHYGKVKSIDAPPKKKGDNSKTASLF